MYGSDIMWRGLLVSDELWQVNEPLLPPEPPKAQRRLAADLRHHPLAEGR